MGSSHNRALYKCSINLTFIRCGLAIISDALNCFFGFKRRDSLTSILVNLGLPSFDTVLANATFSFVRFWSSSNNHIHYPRHF